MRINCLKAGSLFCFIAVAGGALGAHALKKVLDDNQLNAWETAIRFLMFHGLALLVLHLLIKKEALPLSIPVSLIFWGTILFSGSIMLLVTAPLLPLNLSFLGPVTPLGGIVLLTGWGWMIFSKSEK
jgi:uncharacterized membrane protein YgdD (TMEM256/DUF423 family)